MNPDQEATDRKPGFSERAQAHFAAWRKSFEDAGQAVREKLATIGGHNRR